MVNEENIFQTTSNKILVLAVNGEIDLKKIAGKELANRGLDKEGKWVGFEIAEKIFS